MELIAKLKAVQEVVERGTFRSRKVWVVTEENPQYPQTIEVEVAQDKCGLFDNVTPGSEVKLYVNLRGREWTNSEGKTSCFNTLSVWKIDFLNAASPVTKQPEYVAPDEKDDLPF